ncbi:HNH endonuclease signature motif containing protein [Amycolatopsis sp. NPDC051071]|uniref:HNH endonuclease n=1 Tax=Amycolatopsis sp. NPDC051071 TaxID=3154637 RepID=UPI00343284B4
MLRRACMTCPRTAVLGGAHCERCGGGHRRKAGDRVRQAVRRAVNRAGRARCRGCGHTFPARVVQVDHVRPLRDGGRDEPGNIQVLCTACHRDKTEDENRRRIFRPQS